MLDPENMLDEAVDSIKRHLHITWSDTDTDEKLIEMMCDAEVALNHKLGATIDYFTAGQERQLYKNYCLYAWNDCLEQFDTAYRAEIIQVRHKYEVAAYVDSQEDDEDESET